MWRFCANLLDNKVESKLNIIPNETLTTLPPLHTY